jgi:hypothetical protein
LKKREKRKRKKKDEDVSLVDMVVIKPKVCLEGGVIEKVRD